MSYRWIGLDSHQAVAKRLRERLVQRMVAAGGAAPTVKPTPTRYAIQRVVSAEGVEEQGEWTFGPRKVRNSAKGDERLSSQC